MGLIWIVLPSIGFYRVGFFDAPPRPSLVDLLTGLGRAEEKNNVLLSPSHAGVAPIDMKGTFSVYGSRLPCPSKAASDPARERNKR